MFVWLDDLSFETFFAHQHKTVVENDFNEAEQFLIDSTLGVSGAKIIVANDTYTGKLWMDGEGKFLAWSNENVASDPVVGKLQLQDLEKAQLVAGMLKLHTNDETVRNIFISGVNQEQKDFIEKFVVFPQNFVV